MVNSNSTEDITLKVLLLQNISRIDKFKGQYLNRTTQWI